jgi:transcriptional regulator with XRE-family HTH domain
MGNNLTALLKDKGLRAADLARKLKINKATVTRWKNGSVPLTRVFEVERETGISREELRPDFFKEGAQ